MNLDFYVELKLLGDANPGGFSAGRTMCESQSTMEMKAVEQYPFGEEGCTVTEFKNERGHRVVQMRRPVGDAICVHNTFYNESDEDVTLEMLSSVALRDVVCDKVHRLMSCWSAEGRLRSETFIDLHMEVSWNRCATRVLKFGNAGSMPVNGYFPFLCVENSETGEFMGIQIYAPASWQIEILRHGREDAVNIAAGLADRDFGHWMKDVKPGESFTSPRVLIATGKSLYEVCDKLVKAQTPDISDVDRRMGIIFNEFCTTWGNPTFENVKKIADKIARKGIQYLVIDSGWYGQMDGWWNCIGDWDVNEEKFPGGMKPMADYIRSKGMIPGLWFEMESVACMAKYYNSEEHLLKKDGRVLTGAGRRFWDMEDPWVIEYLSEHLIKLLKDCGFGYLKVDYNDTIGVGCDGAESLGSGLYKKVEASRAFFKKIKEEIPDIVIENCSSGGHRLEPAMMEVASQASFSDAHEEKSIPLIAANMHRVIKPEQNQIWAVMRASDSDERIYYSLCATLFGRMCLSGDIYDLSDYQWELVDNGMKFYKKASYIIQSGMTELVKYTTESYNHPTGNQIVVRSQYFGMRGDNARKTSLVVLHRFEGSGNQKSEELLDEALSELGCSTYKIADEYGKADCDFSAKAWIVECE